MWRLQISNFKIKPKYRDNPNTCLSVCLSICLSVCLLLRWVLWIIIFFTNFSIESLHRPFSQTRSAIVIIHVPANTSSVYLCKSESFRDVLCKLLLPYEIFSQCFFLCCSAPSLPRLSLKNVFHRTLRLPDWLFLRGHVFTRSDVLLRSW